MRRLVRRVLQISSRGLAGMRARADRLGGTLRIESGPAGTAIHVEVPLADRGATEGARA